MDGALLLRLHSYCLIKRQCIVYEYFGGARSICESVPAWIGGRLYRPTHALAMAVITLHVQSCNGNPPNSTVAGNPNATREIFWDAVDSAARLRKTQANPAISNQRT
ncbi:hypothetical protein H0G86_006243 [Trichoderma simmonsii]|uniref:Uncharacterized protein n=1 Tax=Trichoderma simmonsii TaxID=1491479 RepID=A0A8G0LB49_9HYPO|nr:hypothetical protein H0G86_006243 [Trichoderma simmonsii]